MPKASDKKPKKPEDTYPKMVRGQTAIAELINRRFRIECFQTYIGRWRKLQGVRGNTPFPAPHGANKYDVAECFAWVEEFIMPHRTGGAVAPASAETFESMTALDKRIKERKLQLLTFEVGASERKLIARQKAEQTSIAVIRRLQQFCVNQDEKEMPAWCSDTLRMLNVEPDKVRAFLARYQEQCRLLTDRRVEKFNAEMELVLSNDGL